MNPTSLIRRTLVVALVLLAAPGAAQVVHEYFRYGPGLGASTDGLPELPEPGLGGESVAAAGGVSYGPDGPSLPDWFGNGGQQNGPRGGRSPVGLDRDTEREGTLHYAAVWDPAVAPFKRGSVRDAVADSGSAPVLVVSDTEVRTVAVDGGAPGPDDDAFTGTFDLRLRPGELVPIPSVAPSMRIHRVDTDPPVPVEILRDTADNWFARADYSGAVQLELAVSAPRFYFAGPVPTRSVAPGPPRSPVAVQRDARRVLDTIGVVDGMTEAEILRALTGWFRGFEARPFPEDQRSDNLYLDLALSRIGVCRHRSIAFVMTAQSAGLRARYVYNEAHAFTEVFLTGHGWLRVDLGGASDDLEVYSDEPTDVHDPGPDPLGGYPDETWTDHLPDETSAWPNANEDPDAAGSDDGGTGGATGAEAADGSDGATSGGAASAGDGADGDGGAERPTEASGTEGEPAGQGTPRLADLPPGPNAPEVLAAPPAGQPQVMRMTTQITITSVPERMWRGEDARVRGRLIGGDEAGAGGRPVEIWLGPADPSREDAAVRQITSTVCDDTGAFDATVRIPTTLAPGRWGLYAVFEGDAVYEPSRSD